MGDSSSPPTRSSVSFHITPPYDFLSYLHPSALCQLGPRHQLPAADGRVLLQPVLPTLSDVEVLPTKDEVSEVRTNEDADDEISVVVHSEQHDKVSDSELEHVEERADRLLDEAGAKLGIDDGSTGGCGGSSCWLAIAIFRWRGGVGSTNGRDRPGVLCDNVAIVLLACATKELEDYDEENDSDTAASEHSL